MPAKERATNGAYKAGHSGLGLKEVSYYYSYIKLRTDHLSSTLRPSSPSPWSCCRLESLEPYEKSRLKVEQRHARPPAFFLIIV